MFSGLYPSGAVLSKSPGLIALKNAVARSKLQSGFSLPITENANPSRRGLGGVHVGYARSKRSPTTSPKKDGGVTPSTCTVFPSTMSVELAVIGAPPISDFQKP